MYKVFCFLLVLIGGTATAQSYEAMSLLYARTGVFGSARMIGAGGSFGSVGADIGSISINPAGLGLFRTSDFSLSPGLTFARNKAEFLGLPQKETNTRFYLNQAGIVFAKVRASKRKSDFSFSQVRVSSFAMAINFQRLASFNRVQAFEGTNNSNSAIDAFTGYVNRLQAPVNFSNYPAEIVYAREAALMRYNSLTGGYESFVRAPVFQLGNVTTKGALDQLDVAFALNFNDKFYVGAGVAIPFLFYSNNSVFSEEGAPDSTFQYYTFQANQRVNGLGVNAKFGMVYRPASWMRLGVAYQIPTTFYLTESFSTAMDSRADSAYQVYDDYNPVSYRVISPMKGTISASFYLKQLGFLSVDYEILNYGRSKYRIPDVDASIADTLNSYIRQYYTFGHNVRVGVETAYKSLRFRAGYVFSASPYRKDYRTPGYLEVRNYITCGFGYRGKHFYADLAYVFSRMKDLNYPYSDFELRNTLSNHTVAITVGWKLFRGDQ